MNLEKAFNNAWYGKSIWTYIFTPLLPLIKYFISKKRTRYLAEKANKHTFLVPIIIVGNITVGGTGKSPMVIALASMLHTQGFKVGIVSRGYGANTAAPLFVNSESSPLECGDEPVMLAKKTQCPLVVCQSRVAAVKHLLMLHDAIDVVISDDGMQHYALERDIEILMLDSERGLGNGHLLPVGPLREPANRCLEVDFIASVIPVSDSEEVKKNALRSLTINLKEQPTNLDDIFYPFPITIDCLVNVFTGEKQNVDMLKHINNWQVMAGIGNPERFLKTLKQHGLNNTYETRWFTDHHVFKADDFPVGSHVVITEKDAVKCQNLEIDNLNVWYLSIGIDLSSRFQHAVMEKLIQVQQEKQKKIKFT